MKDTNKKNILISTVKHPETLPWPSNAVLNSAEKRTAAGGICLAIIWRPSVISLKFSV